MKKTKSKKIKIKPMPSEEKRTVKSKPGESVGFTPCTEALPPIGEPVLVLLQHHHIAEWRDVCIGVRTGLKNFGNYSGKVQGATRWQLFRDEGDGFGSSYIQAWAFRPTPVFRASFEVKLKRKK